MQKKQYWNVKTLVFMALLIAMHLVLTRVLVIDLGAYRISVGSVCTILAGLWLGPVAGAAGRQALEPAAAAAVEQRRR